MAVCLWAGRGDGGGKWKRDSSVKKRGGRGGCQRWRKCLQAGKGAHYSKCQLSIFSAFKKIPIGK